MVAAAYRLFCEKGYPATTMNAIAAEADVAVQTLYFTFHTKGAILAEALGAAVVGFDRWTKPPAEPFDIAEEQKQLLAWWDDFAAAPSAREALAVFVRHGTGILHRTSPLMAAMHAAAGDPDAAAVMKIGEQRRIESFREVIRLLRRKNGGLRHGLTEPRATDILAVVLGTEMYHALVSGRGWSPAECRRFLIDVLTQQLLEERPGGP
jgi:AcrR family transcriptional regulator